MVIGKNEIAQDGKYEAPSQFFQMYRSRTGLTQSEIASLLGLKNFRTLQYWESGETLPRPDKLKKLLELFLRQNVFVRNREMEEAMHLWTVVKEAFDTRSGNDTPYSIFDTRWFEALLERHTNEISPTLKFNTPIAKEFPNSSLASTGGSTNSSLPDTSTGIISQPLHEAVVTKNDLSITLSAPESWSKLGKLEINSEEEISDSPKEEIPSTDKTFPISIIKPPNNLPVSLTSFIGRRQEIEELDEFIKTTRLLTLTGLGGSGKSRLALQVASLHLPDFEGGTWLLELSGVVEAQLLVPMLAQLFGVQEEQGRSLLATLTSYLRPRKILLILDTCEHLVEACAELVASLLRNCPELHIIATSREALLIEGEKRWKIPPLSLPRPEEALLDLKELLNFDAIQLFVDRARAVRANFRLIEENAGAVIEICRRLEGLPLAIELAAARSSVLLVEHILMRLNNRFSLLTTGNRGNPLRQQTLRATLDWSYDLLSFSEKILLRRLAIFAGGWSLEGAEVVCSGSEIKVHEILDLLQQLVEKSMVVVEDYYNLLGYSELRYRLLDTVREYGRDKLAEADETELLHWQHLSYYMALAEEAETGLRSSKQKLWLSRLQAEQDNFSIALSWSKKQSDKNLEAGMRLAGALWWYWFTRSLTSEGRRWLEELVVRRNEVSAKIRIKILNGAGAMAYSAGDYQNSVLYHKEALELSRITGDQWNAAFSMGCLAIQFMYRGEMVQARELAEESLNLALQTGDKWLVADEQLILATVLTHQGHFERAVGLYHQVVEVSRELNNQQFTGFSLLFLGTLAVRKGDLEQAKRFLNEGLSVWRELKNNRMVSDLLIQLAEVASREGFYTKAEAFLTESLLLSQELGNRQSVASAFQVSGSLALKQQYYSQARSFLEQALRLFMEVGDKKGVTVVFEELAELILGEYNSRPGISLKSNYELLSLAEAVCLLGIASNLRDLLSLPVAEASKEAFQNRMVLLRGRLKPAIFEAAWNRGKNASLDQVARLVLERQSLLSSGLEKQSEIEIITLSNTGDQEKGRHSSATLEVTKEVPEKPLLVTLSKRELQVLRLVAQGQTNAQVADELGLSKLTINTQLHSIYRKLAVSSRTAAVRQASEQGLI